MRLLEVGLVVCCLTSFTLAEPATQPATQPQATLHVHSVRINRQSPELQKQFKNRIYNDGNPGVQMQLMLTTEDEMLAPPRDGVSIDTFVDDTFQSLLSTGRENSYSGSNTIPTVSADGHTLLFGVQSPRGPADAAERVFVRGTIETRVARGQSKVETGTLKLSMGATADVGPFRTSISGLSDSGRTTVNLNLLLEGDTSSLRRVRVLAENGRVLQDQAEFNNSGSSEERRNYVNLNIPAGHDPVKLEYTVVERIETVRIPFEAQIDCGNTKAGPIEVVDPKPAGVGPRRPGSRVWPPPLPGRATLPGTRAPMAVPAFAASTQPRTIKTGVDVFSLMVGKPSTEEQKTVQWTNPPWPGFRPAGFTTLRLMINLPESGILSIPWDGISVSKFEDDTGAKLPTTSYQGGGEDYDRMAPLMFSADGKQALVSLYLAAAPTPGATRCTIGGTFKANAGRNPQSATSEELKLVRGARTTAGPFTVTVQQTRNPQFASPTPTGMSAQQVNIVLKVDGPLDRLKGIELIGPDGRVQQGRGQGTPPGMEGQTSTTIIMPVRELPNETAKVRINFHDGQETVMLPFEVTTGIGL